MSEEGEFEEPPKTRRVTIDESPRYKSRGGDAGEDSASRSDEEGGGRRSRGERRGEGRGEAEGEGEGEGEGEDEDEELEGEEPEDREMLFLIEFLVDTLCINPKNLNMKNVDPCMVTGQTCMVLTFLNFPAMNLCEKDWGPENDDNTDDVIKFNAGKSLMFALAESQFKSPPPIYLEVSAHKAMPHGTPNPKFPIGMTKICLSELFKQVFDKIEEKPDKLPLSKSIKDSYPLMGSHSKKPTAEVIIYIRLSCLGQNVVTEFQRGGDECEPFLFKNKESNKVYECKAKEDSMDEEEGADVCPPCPGWGDSGEKSKTCFGSPRGAEGADGGDDDGGLPEGEFDEFGTEVHGHALTIKVQKTRKADEASGTCICSGSKGKKSGTGGGGTAEGGGGCPGNQIAFEVPKNQNLCKAGGTGTNNATVYNVKNCDDKEALRAVGEGEDACEDKDVFVLRIGKKGEVNGKGKLELELRTPKQKIDRRPKGPKMVERFVQTDKEESQKKKGRGKKKKK